MRPPNPHIHSRRLNIAADRQFRCAEACESFGGKNCSYNCHQIQRRSVEGCIATCSRNGGASCEDDCRHNRCFLQHGCSKCIKECTSHGGRDCFDFCSANQFLQPPDPSNNVPSVKVEKHLFGSCINKCLKNGGEQNACVFECRDNSCEYHHYCRRCVRRCTKGGGEDCRHLCTEEWMHHEVH